MAIRPMTDEAAEAEAPARVDVVEGLVPVLEGPSFPTEKDPKVPTTRLCFYQ